MSRKIAKAEGGQAIDLAGFDRVIGYRLRRAQMSVFQRFNERFAEFDLRPAEYSTLALIGSNPGRRQSEIAQTLAIKRANFVALIHRLDQRGLTVRHPQPDDRRSHALHLTAKGKALLARANAVQAQFEQGLLEQMGGPNARDRLLTMLAALGG